MSSEESGYDPAAAAFSRRTGRVAVFDDGIGAGTVVDDQGDIWWFHCTAISDGSRHIEVNEPVTIAIGTGPTGFEAVAVDPRPENGGSDADQAGLSPDAGSG